MKWLAEKNTAGIQEQEREHAQEQEAAQDH